MSPILTSKIDYDRLLEEENFHIDIHLKVQGVKLFKDEDDVDIVLGNTDILYNVLQISSSDERWNGVFDDRFQMNSFIFQ